MNGRNTDDLLAFLDQFSQTGFAGLGDDPGLGRQDPVQAVAVLKIGVLVG